MTTVRITGFLNDKPIAAIQSISFKGESDIEISRIRFDRPKMEELFSGAYVHVAAQKYPLQIVVEEDGQETFRLHNAWLTALTSSFVSGEWVISEGLKLECEKISANLSFSSKTDF